MKDFLSALSGSLTVANIKKHGKGRVYPGSVVAVERAFLCMARDDHGKFLLELAADAAALHPALQGDTAAQKGVVAKKCALTHQNALALRDLFPWTAPKSLRGARTTIGCGDRLGLATAGQLLSVRKYQASPVLAQQSIRENMLTGRTIEGVVDDAAFMVFQAGYTQGYGADGDHLKTMKDIDSAVDAGMAMITLDLSDVMKADAQNWADAEIASAFGRLPKDTQARILSTYGDKQFSCEDHQIGLSAAEARRCVVMYLDALDYAKQVDDRLRSRRGEEYDFEVSIDETTAPTLPSHHLFFIQELIARGIAVNSLAPRFIGEFQKGIDYKGDLAEFERQFAVHCAIGRTHGDYKISVHSGSDKFSVFPAVGKHTNGRFHIKTAGTSWLEAVRLMAIEEPELYRAMHAKALGSLDEVRKLYHVTMNLDNVPPLETLKDGQLPVLMENDDARQLLHITYGPILNDEAIRPRFFGAMHRHEAGYYALLERHFDRHITLLGVPRRQ